MPWATDALLGFDLETTGLDLSRDRPVSYALCRMRAGELEEEITALVDPEVPVPPGATAIHGITTERARSEGVDLGQATADLLEAISAAGKDGVPVVGMNLSFDLTILDRLGREMLGSGLAELGWSGPALDALVLDRHLDQYRKGRRTLPDLCTHYGVSHLDAHDAGADARAACLVVLAIARRFSEISARDLAELHSAQEGWHRDWATRYSAWRVSRGRQALEDGDLAWPIAST